MPMQLSSSLLSTTKPNTPPISIKAATKNNMPDPNGFISSIAILVFLLLYEAYNKL